MRQEGLEESDCRQNFLQTIVPCVRLVEVASVSRALHHHDLAARDLLQILQRNMAQPRVVLTCRITRELFFV